MASAFFVLLLKPDYSAASAFMLIKYFLLLFHINAQF